MSRLELARLAWSVINCASVDAAIGERLTPEQWIQLGLYMAELIKTEREAAEATGATL